MTKFTRLRLSRGMFWRYKYPGPWDYKQECRFVGACLLILLMVVLAAGKLSLAEELIQEQMSVETHQQFLIACLNQASIGGHVGVVIDNKLIGVDCSILSDKPYEGIRRTM